MEQNQIMNNVFNPIQIILFFVIAFLISWSFMIPYAQRLPQDRNPYQLVPAGFGPFLAAVIVIWISKGRTELRHWLSKIFRLRIPVILYLAGAFFLPFLIGGLQYILYLIFGGEPDFSIALIWSDYPVQLQGVTLLLGAMRNLAGEVLHFPPCLSDFIPCWPP